MRAQCFDRTIDPKTHHVLAAYGWLQEKNYLPSFWVSVERDPYRFFSTHDLARDFYLAARDALARRTGARSRGARNPRHQQKRAPALAGG